MEEEITHNINVNRPQKPPTNEKISNQEQKVLIFS